MDYKIMQQLAKLNQVKLNSVNELALSSRPATTVHDGSRRWLENEQVVEFTEPMFRGVNAEFSIKNQVGQSIWFSQLSKVAMREDLKTPMHSIIKFKGECEYYIADKFRTASEFWNAVRNKNFKVKVVGIGFAVNTKNPKTKMIMKSAVNAKYEQNVFDYVIYCINNGKEHEAIGLIQEYKIYALIEI